MSSIKDKSWLERTFSDSEGTPSFKRQVCLLLVVILGVAIIFESDISYVNTLAFLVGSIVGVTGGEYIFKSK